jgi:hypothetical protein
MSFFVITNYIFGLNYVIVDVITLGNNKTYKFRWFNLEKCTYKKSKSYKLVKNLLPNKLQRHLEEVVKKSYQMGS